MFGYFKRHSMSWRLAPALKTRRLRRGMDYFRFLLIGELRMVGGKDAACAEKLLMHNHNSDLIDTLARRYADFQDEFNKVAKLYPHILGELLSIFEEAENYSNMMQRTSMLIPAEQRYSDEHWVNYFNHQRIRLASLYDSYPREISNIFYYFGNTDHDMAKASREIRYRGSFDQMILLISRPGNRQLAFVEEVGYFMSFCEMLTGRKV